MSKRSDKGLLHTEARQLLGTTADVVAGYRFSHPSQDAICLDIDPRDRDGQPIGKSFRLLCDVSVRCGYQTWILRRGYQWNGADIPRFWQFLLGVDRYDPRAALASAFHDQVCEAANQGHVLRVVGDAIFISLLMPITFNGRLLPGVGKWRAIAMYAGVRLYSVWRYLWH